MTRDDMKEMVELFGELADMKGEIEALRAENKCLREDRDSWKALATKSRSAIGPVIEATP